MALKWIGIGLGTAALATVGVVTVKIMDPFSSGCSECEDPKCNEAGGQCEVCICKKK